MSDDKVLGSFFGDENFPIEWENEEEKQYLWFYDDLHCPLPCTPMYESMGWWGPTLEYMYRRFGAPFGKYWIGKIVNRYIYTAVLPRPADEAAKFAPYYGLVMSTYASEFLTWWNNRYLPEIKRNFEYLDTFPVDTASLPELMIYLEEALDINERHFRLHWILNLAQFQASLDFGAVVGELIPDADPTVVGRIMVSIEDRNWDAIEGLWQLKEQVKGDADLKALFDAGDTAAQIMPILKANEKGKVFMEDVYAYAEEYGYKAIHSHEFIEKLWVEDVTPIIETVKGYLAADYDFPSVIQATKDDQAAAVEELRAQIPDTATEEQRAKFEKALELVMKMMPLTPDHHFYIDQGTSARMRLVFLAIGRYMVKHGLMDQPEDALFLKYDELRWYAANPKTEDNPDGFDGKGLIEKNRREREEAWSVRPPDWIGTVTEWALFQEPYKTLWGFPEKFTKAEEKAAEPEDQVTGLGAAPGFAEGRARVVHHPEEFDQVQPGEIMVCIMTNPSWVVVFTKIKGVVTNSGGVLAHPAIVAREFGIPAVVGTMDATYRINTGDTIRMNGNTGVVEILERA
jgi:pyruvate,water dikinase